METTQKSFGATPHVTTVSIDLLKERFADYISSRNGQINLLHHNCTGFLLVMSSHCFMLKNQKQ